MICKIKGGVTRHINQKHNEDSPTANQKQNQTLKLECIFDLLKEKKLKAEENMCYNKELCIKLKEPKTDDQNLWLSAANLCTDFCKPFEKLLQNKDAEKFFFCYTNIILKSSKYLPQISEDMATIIISKVT